MSQNSSAYLAAVMTLSVACVAENSGEHIARSALSASPHDEAVTVLGAVERAWSSRHSRLGPAELAREDEESELLGASGNQLYVEWSQRGVAKSLWAPGLRIPVDRPASLTGAARAAAFLADHSALFGIADATASLVQTVSFRHPSRAATVVRFEQQNAGLPVFGAQLVVHVADDGDVTWVAGTLVPEGDIPAAAPVLTAASAAARVAGSLRSTATRGYFAPDLFGAALGPVHEAWRIRAVVAADEEEVYVDAVSGTELGREPVEEGDGHRETFYCPDCDEAGLRGTLAYDDICHPFGDEAYCAAPNVCTGVPGPCVPPGEVYPGVSKTLRDSTIATETYYRLRHGRLSCCPPYDRWRGSSDTNNIVTAEGNVPHPSWGPGACSASWRSVSPGSAPAQITVGTHRACLDVVAHEFTHGVDETFGNIGGSICSQASSVEEGIADAFGEFADRYTNGLSATWTHGTGAGCAGSPSCSYARNSNLGDPSAFLAKCLHPIGTGCTWLGEPGAAFSQPASWSDFRSGCASWFNATIAGKAAYLMGRESSQGSVLHGGLSVTGIGEAEASRTWYAALPSLSGDISFTTFRNAMISNCLSGGTYTNCVRSLDAVGIWSSDEVLAGFNYDQPVDVVTYPQGLGAKRYIFFYKLEGGVGKLKFRERTCAIGGACSWSSEIVRESTGVTAAGVGAAVLGGSMYVCFRTGGSVLCDRFDGTWHIGPDPGGSGVVGDVSIAYFDGAIYLAYRKASNRIYWRRLVGSTWSAETDSGVDSLVSPVLASSGEDYWSPSTANLWMTYTVPPSPSSGQIGFRKFNKTTLTWTAGYWVYERDHLAVGDSIPVMTLYRVGAAFHRGVFHIAASNVEFGSPYGPLHTLWYASCSPPCDGLSPATSWTRLVLQDGTSEPGVTIDSMGAWDGWLHIWRRLDAAHQITRRAKYSY